jgi:hypothetical protein
VQGVEGEVFTWGDINLGLEKGWITWKMWGFGIMGSTSRLFFCVQSERAILSKVNGSRR